MPDHRKIYVLIVDDDPGYGNLLTRYLEKYPYYETVVSTKIEEVLPMVTSMRFDALILDYHLTTVVKAPAIVKQVREHPSLKVMPIIVVSGTVDYSALDAESLESGATYYIPKDKLNEDVLDRQLKYAVNNARTMEYLLREAMKLRTEAKQDIELRFSKITTEQRRTMYFEMVIFALLFFGILAMILTLKPN